MAPIDSALQPTFVTDTFTAAVPRPAALIAAATSFKLIFDTWLLWAMSLIPSAPPSLLANVTSSVLGSQIGASCAKANVGFAATARTVALGPRMRRNAGSNTWKNGGLVFVGLRNSVNALWRNAPLFPSAAKERGSTSCAHHHAAAAQAQSRDQQEAQRLSVMDAASWTKRCTYHSLWR